MKHKFILFTILLTSVIANAQTVRIDRLADMSNGGRVDDVEWWQGASIEYNLTLRNSSERIDIDDDSIPVWRVWETSAPSLLYVSATGTVVSASNGLVSVSLTASEANLPTGEYNSVVTVYSDSTRTQAIAGAYSELEINYNPIGAGIGYVGARTGVVPFPTNDWTAGYVLTTSDGGTTTYATTQTGGSGDASAWSSYQATQTVDMATFDIDNAGDIEADSVTADTSAGVVIKNLGGNTVATFGAGSGTGTTIAGGLNVGGVISGNGSGVTNVTESDPLFQAFTNSGGIVDGNLSILDNTFTAYRIITDSIDASGGLEITNGNLSILGGFLLADGQGVTNVNAETLEGLDSTAFLTNESNYANGDVLPAVDLRNATGYVGAVSYYPSETNVVSGAWVLDLRTNTYQAVQLSSNVTSWALTVADTNALVPWRVDVYGADTNTLTISTNWTVFGDAGSTWTNSAMSILGSAWRGEVSVGKELYQ